MENIVYPDINELHNNSTVKMKYSYIGMHRRASSWFYAAHYPLYNTKYRMNFENNAHARIHYLLIEDLSPNQVS